MKVGIYDFTIEQGSDLDTTLTCFEDDGTLMDLTGCSARMQIRENEDEDDALVDLSVSNGRITMGGVAGTIRIQLSDTTTAALNFDIAVHDIELTLATGVVRKIIKGLVTLSKQITQDEDEMTDFRIMELNIAGLVHSNYDYKNLLLPMNITITKIIVTSRGPAVGAGQIQIRTAAAGGGTLKATINILTEAYTGEWVDTDGVGINKDTAIPERLVARVTAGASMTGLDIFIWYKV